MGDIYGQTSSLEDKALLSVKEMCAYLSIGQTKCRELLADPANGFNFEFD